MLHGRSPQAEPAPFPATPARGSLGRHTGEHGLEAPPSGASVGNDFTKFLGQAGPCCLRPWGAPARQGRDRPAQRSARPRGASGRFVLRGPLAGPRPSLQPGSDSIPPGSHPEVTFRKALKRRAALKLVSFPYPRSFQQAALFSRDETFQSCGRFLFFSRSSCWDFFIGPKLFIISRPLSEARPGASAPRAERRARSSLETLRRGAREHVAGAGAAGPRECRGPPAGAGEAAHVWPPLEIPGRAAQHPCDLPGASALETSPQSCVRL